MAIKFSHTFHHTDKIGLDREAIKNAIEKQLSAKPLQDGLNKGSLAVNDINLEFSAYKLPDGTVNIGRITPPR